MIIMTADQVMQKAFLHAQRKFIAPAAGTPKYNALLGIIDSTQKLWANEPDVDWNSLYQLKTLTVPASAATTFALDTTINYIAKIEENPIIIGSKTFKLVTPSQLYKYRYSDACAQIGTNLVFSRALDSTLIGLPIQVPSIMEVTDILSGSQVVQVDEAMWLAYASAAEFNRNDLVKVSQYDNLLTLADELMTKMKQNNAGSVTEVSMGDWQADGVSWT